MVLRTQVWFLDPFAPIPLPLGALLNSTVLARGTPQDLLRHVRGRPASGDYNVILYNKYTYNTLYNYVCIYIYIYIHVYVYIERERERQRDKSGGLLRHRRGPQGQGRPSGDGYGLGYCSVLYYTILYYTILYYTILY